MVVCNPDMLPCVMCLYIPPGAGPVTLSLSLSLSLGVYKHCVNFVS